MVPLRHVVLSLVLVVGCHGGAPVNPPPCNIDSACGPADAGCAEPSVEPSAAQVALRGTIRFRATVPVTWSLAEGDVAGRIDDAGLYTAPFARGTFQVVASRDGVEVARVPVTVGATRLEVAAGSPGSIRRVDGTGTEARLGSIKGWAPDGEGAYFSEQLWDSQQWWVFLGGAVRRLDAATGAVSTITTFAEEPGPYCLARVGDALWVAREHDLWSVDPTTGASELLLAEPFGDASWPLAMVAQPGGVYVSNNTRIIKVDPSTLESTLVLDDAELMTYVRPMFGRNASSVGIVEMTRIGSGRLALLVGFQIPLGGTVYFGALVAYLEPSTRTVVDIFHLNGGLPAFSYRALVARENPHPDDPNAFEWQLTAGGTPVVYSMMGLPTSSGSTSTTVDTGPLAPCGDLLDPSSCQTVFNLLGEPLGEAAGLGYHPKGLIAADREHAVIRLLDAEVVPSKLVGSTLAGSYGGKPADGPLSVARFDTPGALAAVDTNTLVTVDLTDERALRWVDLAGDETSTVYHDAYLGPIPDSGPFVPYRIDGIAASGGRIFVSMPAGHLVYALDPTHTPWRRVGLWGYAPEAATVDGPPGVARFESPRGLAADGADNVYVADSASGCVRRIDAAGVTSTVASGLTAPTALAWAGADVLYVAEAQRLLRLDVASGALATLSDSGWQGIVAIGHHGAGVLYVADGADRRVRAVETATGAILDLAGDPGREVAIPGLLPGALARPAGLVVLPSGDLYVTDALDNALLRLR